MILKETKLVQIWEEAARQLSGEFSMPLQKTNGGSGKGGMYLFRILLIYRGISVTIHAGIEELTLKKNEYYDFLISISAKKESQESIELALWRKDFFDKIFRSSKSITGYMDFDNTIGIHCSQNIEKKLPSIFYRQELRTGIINDLYRTYNIQTIDNFILIERKSGFKINSARMIVEEFNRFSVFLDGLVDAGILQEIKTLETNE